MESILLTAARTAGLTAVSSAHHRFEPHGPRARPATDSQLPGPTDLERERIDRRLKDVRRAEIDYETGAISHPNGALTTTTCAELRVVDAQGSISTMVVDAHRLQTREVYSQTLLSSSQQYKVFGRPVSRPWWIPSFVRRLWRWFPAAIPGGRLLRG